MEEIENSTEELSGDLAPETAAPEGAPTPPEQELLDLNSVEKFKFEGKEWTAEDLRRAYLRQEDYTQKTQQLAESRKFYENLPYDLDSVRGNPALAAQFKSIYPKQFHKYLDHALGSVKSVSKPTTQQPTGDKQAVDPQFMERFTKIEQELMNQKVAAINAELDAKFGKFSKTYPYADEEAVIARAQYLVDQGREMDDKSWDDLWKASHDRNQKLAESRYAESVKAQKTMNNKSKDVPAGGAIPGPSAKMPKTIREASELARREIEAL